MGMSRIEPGPSSVGAARPFGLGYWPLAEDDPGVAVRREPVRLVSPDGALVRGILWTPPIGTSWKTAVILSRMLAIDSPSLLMERILGELGDGSRGEEKSRYLLPKMVEACTSARTLAGIGGGRRGLIGAAIA